MYFSICQWYHYFSDKDKCQRQLIESHRIHKITGPRVQMIGTLHCLRECLQSAFTSKNKYKLVPQFRNSYEQWKTIENLWKITLSRFNKTKYFSQILLLSFFLTLYLLVHSFEFHFDVIRQLAGKVDVIFINRRSILSGVRDQMCVLQNTQAASALFYILIWGFEFLRCDENIGSLKHLRVFLHIFMQWIYTMLPRMLHRLQPLLINQITGIFTRWV